MSLKQVLAVVETGPIAIEKGRHPVLESTISEEFVVLRR